MVWLNSSPSFQTPYTDDEAPLSIVSVPNTPLLVILTGTTVSVYHQYTLIPLKSHTRAPESLKVHGLNQSCKVQYYSVNSAKLQQSTHANIFVKTSETHIIIYSVVINYSKSFFQVIDSTSDELLQIGLPLINTTSSFSISNILRTATRSIITGHDHTTNLENIEHFNNYEAEDEANNFQIPYIKLTIFKILKVSIGIESYWLKNNSHNLFIYSHEELQIINIKSFNNEVYKIEDFEWYVESRKSPVVFVQYNEWFNYFLFTNEADELWYMFFDSGNKLKGYKLQDNFTSHGEEYQVKNSKPKIAIHFNPQFNLFVLQVCGQSTFRLYRIEAFEHVKVTFIKKVVSPHSSTSANSEANGESTLNEPSDDFEENGNEAATISSGSETIVAKFSPETSIQWSACGEFFTYSDPRHHWLIFSKFGNCTFNSEEISKELTIEGTESGGFQFLKSSLVHITSNSNHLVVIDSFNSMMYSIDLLTLSPSHRNQSSNLIFSGNEYLTLVNSETESSALSTASVAFKYPILPHFKGIMRKMNNYQISWNTNTTIAGKNCLPAKLTISSSSKNQISMTYGDKISISTPYSTVDGTTNQVLWYNFRNYYMETLNIVDHFWYKDYLILINRSYVVEDEASKKTENDAQNQNESGKQDGKFIDELIILNCSLTKYGSGGVSTKFDSDLIVWRYNLKQLIVSHQFQEAESKSYSSSSPQPHTAHDGHDIADSGSANGENDHIASGSNGTSDQDSTTPSDNLIVVTNDYKIIVFKFSISPMKPKGAPSLFIGINKTIFLKTIAQKLLINNISQINLIDNKHFLILLNTGEFFILKNQSDDSNIYDLILINNCVDFFKFKSLFENVQIQYAYLFTGNSILIYNIKDIVNCSSDRLVFPIIIKMEEYFQPLYINLIKDKSINLIGLENFATYRNKYLVLKTRINHKLILNNFVEFDLINNRLNTNDSLSLFNKYLPFKNFHYCLELLLFKYLTNIDNDNTHNSNGRGDTSTGVLKLLIKLIDAQAGSSSEFIYINCLRKIEVGFWYKFFDTLETTPLKFMNKLISIGEVELCYNYLIIYLNFKKEYDEVSNKKGAGKVELLDNQDEQIILSIIKMLDKAKRWDWCFELCRFIKLLEPTSELLRKIKSEVNV